MMENQMKSNAALAKTGSEHNCEILNDGNTPHADDTDRRLRSRFERLVLQNFISRLSAEPDIDLQEVVKMLDHYCELKKQDIAGSRLTPDRTGSDRVRARTPRSPSAATGGLDFGIPREELKALLKQTAAELYGIELEMPPSDAMPTSPENTRNFEDKQQIG